jgi:hypothetical protein
LIKTVDDLTDRTDRTEKTEKKNLMLEQINQLCLEFCITLLNHELEDNKYKSVVISILAILRF